MPGKKYASIKRPRMYEALRRRGFSKRKAARISNAKRRR
jgi:endonuclease III